MPHNRYFTLDSLEKTSIVTLTEKELQHLTTVMKGEVGDFVEIIDGKGWLGEGKITLLQKGKATIELSKKTHIPPETRPLVLAPAIPFMSHLDFLIEKGTELGADAFWLYPSERSQTISKERLTRLESILIAALKQSGRLYLPRLELFPSLNKVPLTDADYYFGDLEKEAIYPHKPISGQTVFFVGPEGGFTIDETLFLKKHFKATGIKLSPNILRAETAAIVGAAFFSMLRDKSD